MGFVRVEPGVHRCPLPNAAPYGAGTIWFCDECGRRYVRVDNAFSYATGQHWKTNGWEFKVRKGKRRG